MYTYNTHIHIRIPLQYLHYVYSSCVMYSRARERGAGASRDLPSSSMAMAR